MLNDFAGRESFEKLSEVDEVIAIGCVGGSTRNRHRALMVLRAV